MILKFTGVSAGFSVLCLSGLFFWGACADCSAAGSVAGEPLVSYGILAEAGLNSVWQSSVPLKAGEKPRKLQVYGDYLYYMTDSNYLFCLDKKTGGVRFEFRLAVKGLPVCGPTFYEDKLFFIVGNELKIIDPATGAATVSKKLNSIGAAGASGMDRNGSYIYILGSDSRLRVIDANDFLPAYMVSADNDSPINSVIADDAFAIFTTKAGNVVRISPDKPVKKWQFDCSGGITAPAVRDEEWIYIAGEDTKLYKLSADNGAMGWSAEFHTGSKLLKSPVVGRKVVYQYAGDKGFYAVDKDSGKMVWHIDGGLGLLCEKGNRAYVFAEPGLLVVMDNAKGQNVCSVNFACVGSYAVNMAEPVIYIADDNGRVMSISTGRE